ncbi:unnamed protein product [Rotaria sp. Silwood2]|nr:unnamed protein product [Rotaria sp. Silwood2]
MIRYIKSGLSKRAARDEYIYSLQGEEKFPGLTDLIKKHDPQLTVFDVARSINALKKQRVEKAHDEHPMSSDEIDSILTEFISCNDQYLRQQATVVVCKNSGDIKSQVNYIEPVRVFVNLSTTNRGEIEIYLCSPSNTKTTILPRRANDHSDQGFANWAFLTVQLWFENSHGLWKFQICNTGRGSGKESMNINEVEEEKCMFYGKPYRCVSICSEGTYPSETDKSCLPCHSRCGSCRNTSENSCVSCKYGSFLIHDAMICSESCPTNYYTDRNLRKCVRCRSDCASCETSSYICTLCSNGYALTDTDCVKSARECPSGEYFDFTTNK